MHSKRLLIMMSHCVSKHLEHKNTIIDFYTVNTFLGIYFSSVHQQLLVANAFNRHNSIKQIKFYWTNPLLIEALFRCKCRYIETQALQTIL